MDKKTEKPVVELNVNDFKKTASFIAKTLKSYNSVSVNLHVAASIAIYQACSFGRAENLGALYDGLRKSDKLTLRMWVGKHSEYKITVDGKEAKRHWIEFNSKAATTETMWKVKSGAEAFRKASKAATYTGILAEKPFYDKEGNKNDDPFTLVDLMAQISGFVKRVEREAEKANLIVPANINAELAALSAMAVEAKALAELSKSKPVPAKPHIPVMEEMVKEQAEAA